MHTLVAPLGLAVLALAVLLIVWGGLDLVLEGQRLARAELEVILGATLGTGFGAWARGAI
jgi:hypothetical protein